MLDKKVWKPTVTIIKIISSIVPCIRVEFLS